MHNSFEVLFGVVAPGSAYPRTSLERQNHTYVLRVGWTWASSGPGQETWLMGHVPCSLLVKHYYVT
eukprot:3626256-Pleurochrysis_carterae.AAC.2